MNGLAQRQREVMQFIEQTKSERGRMPSVREICSAINTASPNGVFKHLNALERKGYIKRFKRRKHVRGNIRVLKGSDL